MSKRKGGIKKKLVFEYKVWKVWTWLKGWGCIRKKPPGRRKINWGMQGWKNGLRECMRKIFLT